MSAITPQSISDLSRFLDRHTEISEADARALLRAASSGQPINLPDAIDFSGEVLRGQLAAIFRSIPALAGETAPVLAVNPIAVPEPPTSEALAPPAPMSFENRQIAFRAIAGPRLEAMADALAATTVSLDEGTRAIQTARENLPPEGRRTPTIAERAAGQEEFGSSHEAPVTPKSMAADGWKKAFATAQAGG
ncbi:hypothetical protein [Agrobacterium deltaense]|uniref:hypothetical protein n=1 Tax=Agrobacterium deltaense TaxID=1183412 RepID=UPI0009BC40DE|nr:hypothetical protein [Agrobacterium deltaense]CUX08631.1 hypothetical protein AGR7B_Cc10172 [Agrobacterium deltaense RV3]